MYLEFSPPQADSDWSIEDLIHNSRAWTSDLMITSPVFNHKTTTAKIFKYVHISRQYHQSESVRLETFSRADPSSH